MSRMLLTIVAGLAAGVANAGPDHGDHKHGDHKHADHDQAEHAEAATPEHKSLAELFADMPKPELWIGTSAPALKLSHFARGEAITSFEPGHTYVVEMWATWCGPCIRAFPHVASLQEKYSDKLSVIGVNVWEQSKGQERLDLVNEFVAKHTEMKYTVAMEEGTAMSDTWMKPAGQNGIPAAFIVDGAGKVAWIGHPMGMDEPLDAIIKGEYDIEAASQDAWNQELMQIASTEVRRAAKAGEAERVMDVSKALVYGPSAEDPQTLNMVAWTLLNLKDADATTLKLAHHAAKTAAELTEWKSWMVLDTYALAAFKHGDREEAIKWQKKAMELAPDEYREQLQPQMDLFTGEG